MTVKEFAEQYAPNGIYVGMGEAEQQFADAWAQIVLGNYFIQEGMNKINLGKTLLEPPQEEESRIIQ